MNLFQYKFIYVALLFFLSISASFAENKIFHYEPEIVTLTGIIEIKTFPGPPNYENIAKGDQAETGPYLKLEMPINVERPSTNQQDPNDVPEKNIKLVQLVLSQENDLKKLPAGKEVKITGTLFHSITGHHHTQVLMNVQSVEN